MEIKKLIKKAGGYMSVAIALDLSESAVKRWVSFGTIPERYWWFFLKHSNCSVTVDSLHQMNEKGRKKNT